MLKRSGYLASSTFIITFAVGKEESGLWRCLSGNVNEMLKIRKHAVITIIILTFADVKQ